jgi:hypothetical protein
MRIRDLKLFGCRVKSLEVSRQQPNNRSQVALESEDFHSARFPAAAWHTTGT